jgi:hypothetical protein
MDKFPATKGFVTKDSGERQQFASGMQRDTSKGKRRYGLIADGPMFDRWADLMQRGAEKYEARNWMKAADEEELNRFRESAFTHFMQWFRGEADEDHAAAVFFNLNGAEYVKTKMAQIPVITLPASIMRELELAELHDPSK